MKAERDNRVTDTARPNFLRLAACAIRSTMEHGDATTASGPPQSRTSFAIK
ncbi:hypothetical protein E4U35_001342 [Claviceps purpurea]|nr:hypothetical protein E4U37_000917 [Claviceps purpurea]KAG6206922.1 hypothetical protein E4U35_001342 [Claviceps purpurea]